MSRIEGLTAIGVFERPIHAVCLQTCTEQVLSPTVRQVDIVLFGNLRLDKPSAVSVATDPGMYDAKCAACARASG